MSCVQCGGETSGWDFCDRCEQEIRMRDQRAAEEREEMGRLEAAIQKAAAKAEARCPMCGSDPDPDPASTGEKPDQDQTPETGPGGAQT